MAKHFQDLFSGFVETIKRKYENIATKKYSLFILIFRILAKFCTKNFIFSYGLHHNQPIM
jgi:hypothetical protein